MEKNHEEIQNDHKDVENHYKKQKRITNRHQNDYKIQKASPINVPGSFCVLIHP